jgi:leucyl aminopeptidase
MTLSLDHAKQVPDDAEVVGVPVFADGTVADGTELDADELEAQGFEGKRDQTARLRDADGRRVVAVGVGPAAEVDLDTLRRAAAALVKATRRSSAVATTLLAAAPAELDKGKAAQAIAEGAELAAYTFTTFKSESEPSRLERVTVVGAGGKKAADGVERGSAVAAGVTLARDLINTPPGSLRPADFAAIATDVAKRAGLKVKVLDEAEMVKMGMGGIAGVGQGSDSPPRMVRLTWAPEGAKASVTLVGKGITFDSGGLSLKTGEGMMRMKADMSGAAAVLGAMSALPAVAPKAKVTGYLCLAENMPSGTAIRPGDVLKIRNGKTVEVLNTDAEGRLVLSDGLSLAVEEEPDAIVDLATLTGACIMALGPKIAGLMGNNDPWIDQVQAAAERAGERVWPLPLPDDYRKMLDSDVADMKNIGGKYGGAITAGLFLKEFVADVPWVHLDIAGPADVDDSDGYVPKGGSGFGVRTLLELVSTFKKPKR